jgi:hypothetical protein
MMLKYAGTGTYEGYGRYCRVSGTEVVDSVTCLKAVIRGHGNTADPDADTEWCTLWLAQDESGAVWVLKYYDSSSGTNTELGRVNAVVLVPLTFAVGQKLGEIGDCYGEVLETGVTVDLATGLGPYEDCVKLRWVEGPDEDFYYLAPGIGIVREEWQDAGLTNGWDLQEIFRGAVAHELILNYGITYGLWQYDQETGWAQLNTVAPSQMATADVDNDGVEELVAAFPGAGLYVYEKGIGWTQINAVVPNVMITHGKGLAINFGTRYGLWHYDSSRGWKLMNSVPPDQMVAVDVDVDGDEELVAAFSEYGLYTYESDAGWTLINTVIPDAMVRCRNKVICDYGNTYGLWCYSGFGGWSQLNTIDPDSILVVDVDNNGHDELGVSFVGFGLYIYEPLGGTWQRINTVIPEAMVRQGNGVAADFGTTHGLWVWSREGGWQPRNTADPEQMTAVDIDYDGVEELVASFGGYGLYYHDETNGWQFLNAVIQEDIKPINFYP